MKLKKLFLVSSRHKPNATAGESQKDSGSKPRVARLTSPARTELPWVNVVQNFFNPNGVVSVLTAQSPQPRWGWRILRLTQGSSYLATLGWTTQSPRDCSDERHALLAPNVRRPKLRAAQLFLTALLLPATLLAAAEPQTIPLWPNGAPGFESRKDIPEQAASYWVKNINNPSLTVFLPPGENANGAAVVICPGGGFRELVFGAEGVEPAKYFNKLGVAAFVLKYRLFRETNSVYTSENAHEDGLRAMRLVRSRAGEWGIDTNRIGMVGYSAGGEMVSLTSFGETAGVTNAPDPIDRASARPDFIVEIYPGPLGVPTVLLTNVPPAFLLCADDDRSHSVVVTGLLDKYRKAKVPAELHLYAKGGHGFNQGQRSKLASIHNWPERLTDWMNDNNILDPAVPPPADVRHVIRIKAGSAVPFTDADGNVWEADHGFADGDTTSRNEDLPIANTTNPALYRSERYSMTSFSLPLANGKYTVKLHFAETFEENFGPGLRVFSFNVAGHEFKDFDLFVKAGGSQRAYVQTIPVDITGGKLDITFAANIENPEINGIEIIPVQ